MSLVSKLKLADLSDAALRKAVEGIAARDPRVEQAVVLTALHAELDGLGGGKVGSSKPVASASAPRATKSAGPKASPKKAAASPAASNGNGSGNGNGHSTKPASAASSKPKSGGATAKSRKLQGAYLAAIRRVPKSKRGGFNTIAQSDGREAAITAINRSYPAAASA